MQNTRWNPTKVNGILCRHCLLPLESCFISSQQTAAAHWSMQVELPSVLNSEIMSLLQLLCEGFCFSKALTSVKVTHSTCSHLANFCSATALQNWRPFSLCSFSPLTGVAVAHVSISRGLHHNQQLSPQSYSKVYLVFFIFLRTVLSPSMNFVKVAAAHEAAAHGTILSATGTVIQGGL